MTARVAILISGSGSNMVRLVEDMRGDHPARPVGVLSNVPGAAWLAKARDSLAHGSKLAALWIHEQLWVTRHASLKEVFQAEIQLVTNIVRHPEFTEGVRALLIDKDRNPQWAYPTSREVPKEVLDQFFSPPWPKNPLADL